MEEGKQAITLDKVVIFLNYNEAVAYIDETPKFTTKNSLEHTRECLRRLGNPQEAFRVIHVAGTNGKGSTCAFLTSMLREAGFSCGLFTSPHLIEINERFQINEVPVDNEIFLAAFHRVKEMADELVAQGSHHPTYFEMLFLMGMLIFKEAGVDYVTLETGLGGRLDATTSIENPMACVITSISMDHMEYLGNSLEKIASEKAGIIVPGVPVIFDGNHGAAAEVVRKKAQELGSPFYEVWEADCEILRNTRDGIDFSMKNGYYEKNIFSIPFVARYQVMNAALALKTMEVMREQFSFTTRQLQMGMAQTRWQGRMETVLPGVIVDGAHNEDGVFRFVETARYFQEESKITLLFSAVSDKDYKDMIRTICQGIHLDQVVTTQIDGYRVVPAQELAQLFRDCGCSDVIAEPEIPKAFVQARKKQGDGLLFCVGSLYLVGEIKDEIRRQTDD